MSAIDDDETPLGQPAAPMLDLLGRATDRTDDDRIVGLESRAPPNVDNDRSQLCPEPDIKGLWRNRKTVLSIHDRALLALRAAQNLDGRPSDGASAVPRGRYIYYVGRLPASPDGSLRRQPAHGPPTRQPSLTRAGIREMLRARSNPSGRVISCPRRHPI